MGYFNGIYAASLSILDNNLQLDCEKTLKHAENLIEKGCHGVIFFGSTGQSQLISLSEKIKLINILPKSKHKDKFIIGTGLNSLGDNINLLNISKSIGFENFGYKFSIECVSKLAESFPKNVLGVKDSSYNLYENLKIENFSVMPGSESKLLKGLELGCSGIITATTNVTSYLARDVYDKFKNNLNQTSNEKLCMVRSIFDKYNLISGLHTFMSTEDSDFKNLIPPLKLLSKDEEKLFFSELDKLNFNIKNLKAA